MTPKSINSHLKPYSIYSKRKTTIAHAFASALAPSDEFNAIKVEAALKALGQENLKILTCVYCGEIAQTWDHLENLVKDGNLNGYGHQIGNLVPSCKDCNSAKAGKPFRDFVKTLKISDFEKQNLISRLENHLSLAKPIDKSRLDSKGQETFEKFNSVKEQIINLMREADGYAATLRKLRNG